MKKVILFAILICLVVQYINAILDVNATNNNIRANSIQKYTINTEIKLNTNIINKKNYII